MLRAKRSLLQDAWYAVTNETKHGWVIVAVFYTQEKCAEFINRENKKKGAIDDND